MLLFFFFFHSSNNTIPDHHQLGVVGSQVAGCPGTDSSYSTRTKKSRLNQIFLQLCFKNDCFADYEPASDKSTLWIRTTTYQLAWNMVGLTNFLYNL